VSPGKLAVAAYEPAVAVGKVQEYEEELDATSVGLLTELVQVTDAFNGSVTVHAITPPGC
jgi:hypothetical protein